MNSKQIENEKRNAEIMILDALQTLTKNTGKVVRSISFDFKKEQDGTQREFRRVTITFDPDA